MITYREICKAWLPTENKLLVAAAVFMSCISHRILASFLV